MACPRGTGPWPGHIGPGRRLAANHPATRLGAPRGDCDGWGRATRPSAQSGPSSARRRWHRTPGRSVRNSWVCGPSTLGSTKEREGGAAHTRTPVPVVGPTPPLLGNTIRCDAVASPQDGGGETGHEAGIWASSPSGWPERAPPDPPGEGATCSRPRRSRGKTAKPLAPLQASGTGQPRSAADEEKQEGCGGGEG